MNLIRREMTFVSLCVWALFLLPNPSGAITRAVQPSTRPPESPCPGVLTYEERDPTTARSRWSASIEIRPEQSLRGFTLNVDLDKPAELLGNVVGEVRTRDNQHFEINTRKTLPAGIPFSIRIFVKHSTAVPYVKTIKLNGAQICPTDDSYFQTEPRRVVARPGESVLLLGRLGTPLRHCHFHLPNRQLLDLSQGRESTATNRYEYHGRGLASGECGLKIKQVQDDNDGVVECRVKPAEESSEWMASVTTFRVTNLRVQDLPVFDIVPRRKTVNAGDNITVTCNADRPLNLCHFRLPDKRVLNFDLGPDSEQRPEYRYRGSGLQHGQCGVTLTGVGAGGDGFIVCQVGRWPDGVTGAWERDALKIRTVASTVRPLYNGHSQEATTPDYPVFFPTRTPAVSSNESVICGKTVIPPPVPLITSAQRAYRGESPWHIALYQSARNGSLLYICGGSLIGARSVVTAAHCVTKPPFDRAVDPATLMVYLGKYHLRQWSDDGLQEKQVDRIVVHPSFNRTGFKNDLAVLILRSAVNYTDYVRPVCLWDSTKTDINEVEGKQGTVVGWGIDERGHLTQELMKAGMPVVSYTTCLWSKPQHFLQFTRDTTYCAGFRNGTSVCNGDSGGGMVFDKLTSRGRRWFLRGLVSNSVPRTIDGVSVLVCDPSHYVVFTDLAQFLSWLTPYAVL